MKDGKGFDHLHIVRVEQLYPFPSEKISEIVSTLSKCKRTCLGTRRTEKYGFMVICKSIYSEIADDKKVSYVGRIHRSSPSEGDGDTYKVEQKRIIEEALKSKLH